MESGEIRAKVVEAIEKFFGSKPLRVQFVCSKKNSATSYVRGELDYYEIEVRGFMSVDKYIAQVDNVYKDRPASEPGCDLSLKVFIYDLETQRNRGAVYFSRGKEWESRERKDVEYVVYEKNEEIGLLKYIPFNKDGIEVTDLSGSFIMGVREYTKEFIDNFATYIFDSMDAQESFKEFNHERSKGKS